MTLPPWGGGAATLVVVSYACAFLCVGSLRDFPPSCSFTCSPSKQAAEAPCPAVVPPLVHTLFPSACGQLVGASASAGTFIAAAVCPGNSHGLPSLSHSGQPVAKRWSRRPWLTSEWLSRDTCLHDCQRTSRYIAEAAGSLGSVGPRPTLPSSTAAPSHTPRRHRLGGVQATTGSRSLCRHGMPVCAAARGPVSAAAETPLPLACPAHGWAARLRSSPPSARQGARKAAAPCLTSSPPAGRRQKAPAPLRS